MDSGFRRSDGVVISYAIALRRAKPTPGSQLALFPSYRYHAFITDREGDTMDREANHRSHAEVENANRHHTT